MKKAAKRTLLKKQILLTMNPKLPKFVFYLLTFTWGLPFTLIGCITAIFLIIKGYHPTKHGYCFCFEIGENWGGINLGLFFIVDKRSKGSRSIKNHEHGHAVQNCYLGPFMIFAVALPSLIRSRYRAYLIEKKGIPPSSLPPYDSIWFEGSATRLGNEIIKYIESK